MLKNLFIVLCIAVVVGSCLKSSEKSCAYPITVVTAPKAEQDSLKAYLDSNNIDATLHPSGFYYKIITPGSGTDTMQLCSEILINYRGQFKDGQVFDQGSNQFLVLGATILGWQKGIPLLKRGGEIKLYIPPSLGYGYTDLVDRNTNAVIIPANSTLLFDVKLLDYTMGF